MRVSRACRRRLPLDPPEYTQESFTWPNAGRWSAPQTAGTGSASRLVPCCGARGVEYIQTGRLSSTLFLYNNSRSAGAYVSFLERSHPAPVEYVLGLFDEYDIVVLCERAHPERTQWELIYSIISDEPFINQVGHVFIEYGQRNYQQVPDGFLATPGLGSAAVHCGGALTGIGPGGTDHGVSCARDRWAGAARPGSAARILRGRRQSRRGLAAPLPSLASGLAPFSAPCWRAGRSNSAQGTSLSS